MRFLKDICVPVKQPQRHVDGASFPKDMALFLDVLWSNHESFAAVLIKAVDDAAHEKSLFSLPDLITSSLTTVGCYITIHYNTPR